MSSFKAAELITRDANLRVKPSPTPCLHRNCALGDLHGNALKLLYFLVEKGIVSQTNEQYGAFSHVYPKSLRPIKSLAEQKRVVDELIDALSLSGNPLPTLRLIGDELADRGENDYFTLRVLEKLETLGVPFEIYQSNHSIDFTIAYERCVKHHREEQLTYRKAKAVYELALKTNRTPEELARLEEELNQARKAFNRKLFQLNQVVLEVDHNSSMSLGLNRYLSRGVVSASELDDLVAVHERHQRLIGYSLTESGITIYSHAPVDLFVIENIANKLQIHFDSSTKEALAKSIEAINKQYNHILFSGQVETYFSVPTLTKAYQAETLSPKDNPLEYLLWNRDLASINREQQHQGYDVAFVHGHTGSFNDPENVYNLDSVFGKGLPQDESTENEGIVYPTFVEDGQALESELEADFITNKQAEIERLNQELIKIKRAKCSAAIQREEERISQLVNLCKGYQKHLNNDLNWFLVDEDRAVQIRDKLEIIGGLIKSIDKPSTSLEGLTQVGLEARQSELKEQISLFSSRLNESKTKLSENTKWFRAFLRGVGMLLDKVFLCSTFTQNQPTFFKSHGEELCRELNSELAPFSAG